MKLTNENVAKLRARGWSYRKIADYFGKQVATIYDRDKRHQRKVANQTR